MEAIKYYVKGAFSGVEQTPEVLEQQEEIVADLIAKVADLVSEGKTQEEAMGLAIGSMGDLSTLVAEFQPAEVNAPAIPTTPVWATRLDLAVVALSVGVGAAVMIGSTALGALVDLVEPGAGFTLLAVLGLGLWWVRAAYLRYQADPNAVEVREQEYSAHFRKALLVWGGTSLLAVFMNMTTYTDFWCWPVWVAGGTWALAVKMEKWLSRRPEFLAPEPPQE